jgi:hypothetical protein
LIAAQQHVLQRLQRSRTLRHHRHVQANLLQLPAAAAVGVRRPVGVLLLQWLLCRLIWVLVLTWRWCGCGLMLRSAWMTMQVRLACVYVCRKHAVYAVFPSLQRTCPHCVLASILLQAAIYDSLL